MPNLTVRDKGRAFTFQIEGDAATIGRAPANAVEIHDAKASKEHCRIERVGSRWKLVDLESKNGTRVNGSFCNKAWLNHGDTIEIGAAKIRFGVEGAGRVGLRRRAVPVAREPDLDEEEPPPPPPKRISSDTVLKWSLAVLGTVVVLLIANYFASKTRLDEYNRDVLAQAENLVGQGRYEEAEKYLRDHGDPSGNAYYLVEQRIKEIQSRKGKYYQNVKEQEAKKILSKLGRRIKAYHAGKSVEPEQILELVERLKTEFAGTEAAADARKEWRAWFAGRVPQRAVERLASESRLRKDWTDAVARADAFRKEWRFREARETIERYVAAREAILGPQELEYYQGLRDQQLDNIDRLAASVYGGREGAARRLLKNKRYDAAIEVYQEVVEKFGIDYYVRKAQAEIGKIQQLKASGQ
ncbi:MAG: FHA domain-containing protein [Planctomycetota bacterium]